MPDLKRTPLRDFHAAHGGRLVDFAGWEMPVQYRSILEEHKAVRTAAGLFDVSHMGEVDVTGPDAAAFLGSLITNDVSKMQPGRVLYSPMCHPDGGVIDDLLVYMRGPEDFLLVVNAGNKDADVEWMKARAAGRQVEVADRSSEWALLALQGPRSAAILRPLTRASIDGLKYYHFTQGEVAGRKCLISRTGYTGEDGFELYHRPADSVPFAEALLAAGKEHALELCGLGARDSLRLEAGFPLYGHELSREISPLTAGLGWTVKLEREGDFSGKTALAAEKRDGSQRRVVHFKTGDRRIIRAETPVAGEDGAIVGRVLSGTLSPILGEAIGSALVDSPAASKPLHVDVRGTLIELQLVKPPFIPLKKVT